MKYLAMVTALLGFLWTPAYAASLDTLGSVDVPISSSKVEVNRTSTINGTVVSAPVADFGDGDNTLFNSYFVAGQESVSLGGQKDTQGNVAHTQLNVLGYPYGNYQAGCTLCVFSTADGLSGAGGQAALSGLDYHLGAYAVAHGDAAEAGFYQFDDNSPARITAEATSFTDTTVTLKTPLTTAQMALLHNGMYIATNVIDPTQPTVEDTGLPHENAYWGFVNSWTSTTITVYGWAVLVSGSETAGQVPDITHLDTTKSTYTVPMVFIGAPGKVWSKNTYVNFDGSRVYGSSATSRANQYEREEMDFRATNFSNPNSFSYHGWTTSFQCIPCDSKAATPESYAYLVNGPGLPRAFVAQLYGDGLEFSGYNTWIPGDQAPPAAVGSNHIMWDFKTTLPSNNVVHLDARTVHDQSDTSSWGNYSIRLGMNVDGTRAKDVYSGGTDMAWLAWNYQGQVGSWCILSNGTTLGLCQLSEGNLEVHTATAFDADVTAKTHFYLNGGSIDSSLKVTDQGTVSMWNTVDEGAAMTEYVNIDPGTTGGFSWYDKTTGSTVSGADRIMHVNNAGLFIDKGKVGSTVYATQDINTTLTTIRTGNYSAGDRVYCGDCTNANQASGEGTGRWIFLDNKLNWRSDDGVIATE